MERLNTIAGGTNIEGSSISKSEIWKLGPLTPEEYSQMVSLGEKINRSRELNAPSNLFISRDEDRYSALFKRNDIFSKNRLAGWNFNILKYTQDINNLITKINIILSEYATCTPQLNFIGVKLIRDTTLNEGSESERVAEISTIEKYVISLEDTAADYLKYYTKILKDIEADF